MHTFAQLCERSHVLTLARYDSIEADPEELVIQFSQRKTRWLRGRRNRAGIPSTREIPAGIPKWRRLSVDLDGLSSTVRTSKDFEHMPLHSGAGWTRTVVNRRLETSNSDISYSDVSR